MRNRVFSRRAALGACTYAAGRLGLLPPVAASGLEGGRIQPWPANPFYWEYKGEPVLLVGGSDDDNLFQWPAEKLRPHLDAMFSAGGNYVRNTMSDRRDGGFEIYPFLPLPGGKYDLSRWNPEYWSRLEQFLRWTAERDIIVQIEIWDRFDLSREHWRTHPYKPANNVNYTPEESGFEADYPEHPGRNRQPFFFTTPGQRHNRTVLRYQQAFVDKLLSIALEYPHVLYCIDNETSGEEEWSRYWASYIKTKAREKGVRAFVTEMWDPWDVKAPMHQRTFDHPELYDFVDVSQNNHNKGERHWRNALWVRDYLRSQPRPVNTVKTYGADNNKFGHTDQDGIERLWRHLLAGFASARFHRPPSGLGLNRKAQAALRAVRKAESLVRFWELAPRLDLVSEREENEAYLAANPGKAYLVYFTRGGSVKLQAEPGPWRLHWIDVDTGDWGEKSAVEGGQIALATPGAGNWVAVLVR